MKLITAIIKYILIMPADQYRCLPYSVPVHDIVIHPRENEIILGTHGRSIYIAKLDGVQKAKK